VLDDSGMVIPMVIQTIQLDPPEPNWADDTSHLTSLDPTGADQLDAEHPPTDLAVGGSSPSRRATKPQVSRYMPGERHRVGSPLDRQLDGLSPVELTRRGLLQGPYKLL
jgi:hypothetical protein